MPNEPNPVAARHSGISQSRGGSQYTLGKRPKSLALPLKSLRGRRGGQFGPLEDGLRHGMIDVMIILHGTSPRLLSANLMRQRQRTDQSAGFSKKTQARKPFIVKFSQCYYHIMFKIHFIF